MFDDVFKIVNGLFQKKSKQGGLRIYFLKTSLKFFIFLLYPWKFKTKQSSTLDIPQNCVRSLKNSKAKNKDPWKSHIIFSCSHLEIRLHLINPLKFHMLFLWCPWKFHILDPPSCLDFFWNSPMHFRFSSFG